MRKMLGFALLASQCIVYAANAADVPVDQAGQKFNPDSITVKAGDSVTFTNKDDVTHNIHVITSGGDSEDKGLQKPGENIKETFAKAGDYQVRCSIHPKMKMTVTVQ